MSETKSLTDEQIAAARQRRAEAIRLQEIEGNPLTDADKAMFEMFDRERWPHEKRIAYITARAKDKAAPLAAE